MERREQRGRSVQQGRPAGADRRTSQKNHANILSTHSPHALLLFATCDAWAYLVRQGCPPRQRRASVSLSLDPGQPSNTHTINRYPWALQRSCLAARLRCAPASPRPRLCWHASACLPGPPSGCSAYGPGLILPWSACLRLMSCFSRVRPCAQGRCGRCPHGPGIIFFNLF